MQTRTEPSVTVLIPTYREHAFGECLDYLLDHLDKTPERSVEILVIDDSSPAEHAQLIAAVRDCGERRSRSGPARRIEVMEGPHRGKGAAIRAGAFAAKGSVVFLIDADIPVVPEFIEVFLEKIAAGADVVIGVRDPDRYGGDLVRLALARGLLALQTVAVFHRRMFADTQCGFKAFRADVLRDLAKVQLTEGGMYDLEYLYVAVLRGLRVEQVPVTLRGEVRATRINLLRCVTMDPGEIGYFKLRGMLGYYRRDRE
jgi:glycosyltransferase involved in cell wall biosynthesis